MAARTSVRGKIRTACGNFHWVFLGSIGLVFEVFAGPIISAFTTDPEVAPFGVGRWKLKKVRGA